MRETVGSMMAYFIIVGVAGIAYSRQALGDADSLATRIIALVSLAVALGFLGTGISLRKFIRDAPGVLKGFILTTAILQGVGAVVGALAVYLGNPNPLLFIAPLIGLVICVYLLANVIRLAALERRRAEIEDAEV